MQAITSIFSHSNYEGLSQWVNKGAWAIDLINIALGILALIIHKVPPSGIYCLIVAAISLVFVELPISKIQKFMDFFVETFIWRAIAYVLISIPCFFDTVTIVAGILWILLGLAYGFCWWKGEKLIVDKEHNQYNQPIVREEHIETL